MKATSTNKQSALVARGHMRLGSQKLISRSLGFPLASPSKPTPERVTKINTHVAYPALVVNGLGADVPHPSAIASCLAM